MLVGVSKVSETALELVRDHVKSMGHDINRDGILAWFEPKPGSVSARDIGRELTSFFPDGLHYHVVYLSVQIFAVVITKEQQEVSGRSVDMILSLFNRFDSLCGEKTETEHVQK